MGTGFTTLDEFLLTRPSRDVTMIAAHDHAHEPISTHTPLTGRDKHIHFIHVSAKISTHTPLTGRDNGGQGNNSGNNDFYSHAPHGT